MNKFQVKTLPRSPGRRSSPMGKPPLMPHHPSSPKQSLFATSALSTLNNNNRKSTSLKAIKVSKDLSSDF